eukprot:5312708-Amphidinium_carterae.5
MGGTRPGLIETCAIGATYEGKPVKQHSEQEHVQKTITDRLPHPKPGLVKIGTFLSTSKRTANTTLLIGQFNRFASGGLKRSISKDVTAAADQQHDLSTITFLEEQPGVVVASPPFTYLAEVSKLNAKHSPESFAEKRTEAIQIPGQVAHVVTINYKQTAGSWWRTHSTAIFGEYQRLQHSSKRKECSYKTHDQCMYGFKNDRVELHQKPTNILTNLPMAEKR